MIIIGEDPTHYVKIYLSEQFSMTDLGLLWYFLSLEVAYNPKGYLLAQQKYATDLVTRAGLADSRIVYTPLELNHNLRFNVGVSLSDPTRYRQLVGSLIYLTITHPDIAHVVNTLSQFMSTPTSVHFAHLLRLLRYVWRTISRGLSFASVSDLKLQAFLDAT
jgi:hypothetical protein